MIAHEREPPISTVRAKNVWGEFYSRHKFWYMSHGQSLFSKSKGGGELMATKKAAKKPAKKAAKKK